MLVFCYFGFFFSFIVTLFSTCSHKACLSLFNMPFHALTCKAAPHHCQHVTVSLRDLWHTVQKYPGGLRDRRLELTFHLWAAFVDVFIGCSLVAGMMKLDSIVKDLLWAWRLAGAPPVSTAFCFSETLLVELILQSAELKGLTFTWPDLPPELSW